MNSLIDYLLLDGPQWPEARWSRRPTQAAKIFFGSKLAFDI